MNFYACIGEFGQGAEKAHEASWHDSTVFEPIVEHIAHQVDVGGLVLYRKQKIGGSALRLSLVREIVGAQMKVGEKVDKSAHRKLSSSFASSLIMSLFHSGSKTMLMFTELMPSMLRSFW